jgi:hypothetical protein
VVHRSIYQLPDTPSLLVIVEACFVVSKLKAVCSDRRNGAMRADNDISFILPMSICDCHSVSSVGPGNSSPLNFFGQLQIHPPNKGVIWLHSYDICMQRISRIFCSRQCHYVTTHFRTLLPLKCPQDKNNSLEGNGRDRHVHSAQSKKGTPHPMRSTSIQLSMMSNKNLRTNDGLVLEQLLLLLKQLHVQQPA